MQPFTYSILSPKSKEVQYADWQREYLKSQWDYAKSLRNRPSLANVYADEMNYNFKRLSAQQRESANRATNLICGTIEQGNDIFNENLQVLGYTFGNSIENLGENITSAIGNVENKIEDLQYFLEWGFSKVLEQNKLTHKYLGKLVNINSIPDSQKQKYHFLQKGTQYLQSAFKDSDPNSLFFEDAYDEFNSALKYDKRDYFALYRLGLIHLLSAKYLDFKKSEISFAQAGRYLVVEATTSGTLTSNNLSIGSSNFVKEAASCYRYAGKASYLQQDFDNAVKYLDKSLELSPNQPIVEYEKAKYLSANKNWDKSIEILEKLLRRNPKYTLKVTKDSDFFDNFKLIILLVKLVHEVRSELNAILLAVSKNIYKTEGSVAINDFRYFLLKAEDTTNYLGCLAILKDLKENKQFLIKEYCCETYYSEWEFKQMTFKKPLKEFVEIEATNYEAANHVKEINKLKKEIIDLRERGIDFEKRKKKVDSSISNANAIIYVTGFFIAMLILIIYTNKLSLNSVIGLALSIIVIIIAINFLKSCKVELNRIKYVINNNQKNIQSINNNLLKLKEKVKALMSFISAGY